VPAPTNGGPPWVVVQHTATEGPGLLAGVLADAGADVRVVRLDLGHVLPAPSEITVVVVMGGPMGVHDTARYPWLEPEQRWLAAAVDAGLPGPRCLPGGPAGWPPPSGAEVTTGEAPEIGVGAVALMTRAGATPSSAPKGRAARGPWHGRHLRHPDGAVPLASSDPGTRTRPFRLGHHVYGLQFHLEVDDEVAAGWAPDLPAGISLDGPERRAGGGCRAPCLRSFHRPRMCLG